MISEIQPQFKNLLAEFLSTKVYADSSVKSYRNQLKHFHRICSEENISILDVSESQIASYLGQYEFKKTKTSYKTILNSFYKWLLKKKLINYNPVEDVSVRTGKRKVKPALKENDFLKFLGYCQGLREVTLVSFFWYTGIRSKELRNLRMKDVDLERNTIFINDSKSDSGYRKIPIHPNFRDLLRAYTTKRKSLRTNIQWLFLTRYGNKIADRTLIAFINRLQKDWDGKFGCHDFRRAFVTRLYRKTNDIALCQKFAGHSSIATTRSYIIDDVEEQADKFNSIEF